RRRLWYLRHSQPIARRKRDRRLRSPRRCIHLRHGGQFGNRMTSDTAAWGMRGMAVAPHSLAAQSAVAVLREGGNAIEAMVAAAASIAVVYPHMNSIGGDAFWLIHAPGESPRAIDACGAAAGGASIGFYREQGHASIPFRSGVAACTVAGTVSGWSLALDYSRDALGGRLPLSRLLADAIHYARH